MLTLIRPIYTEPAKHLYKIMFNNEYRKFWLLESKLRKIPRFTEFRTEVNNSKLLIPDSASFLSAYKEIFVEQIYAFKFSGDKPRILDLGANIGLSVLYFKKLFPKALITAFEADPKIFDYLKHNVSGYADVQLINKAAWNKNTTLKFCSEGADAGRAAFEGDRNPNLIDIDAIDMNQFLHGAKFDFLKMDIEGAEEFVLPACKDHLEDFKYVFVEYHSKVGHKQCLENLISILSGAGFRIHLHSVMCSPSPFVEVKVNTGFDLQLNIFGWKN